MTGFLNLDLAHDETSREAFVLDLKLHINTGLGPSLRDVYEKKAAPRIRKDLGRGAKDRHEIRKAMVTEPTWQSWASLWSTSQELMWDTIGGEIDRLDEDLRASAKVGGAKKGSVRLDPAFQAPRYVSEVHIHGQPGGYDLNLIRRRCDGGRVLRGRRADLRARAGGRRQGQQGDPLSLRKPVRGLSRPEAAADSWISDAAPGAAPLRQRPSFPTRKSTGSTSVRGTDALRPRPRGTCRACRFISRRMSGEAHRFSLTGTSTSSCRARCCTRCRTRGCTTCAANATACCRRAV